MGCSTNAGCFSTLTINEGERAICNIILPTNPDLSWRLGNRYHVWAYNIPISLPIHGIANDYSGFESIDRDEIVIALENYFELSIEDILECIICNDAGIERVFFLQKKGLKVKNSEVLELLSSAELVFDHEEFYSQFSIPVEKNMRGEDASLLYSIYELDLFCNIHKLFKESSRDYLWGKPSENEIPYGEHPIKDEINKFAIFSYNCLRANLFLNPRISGSQWGEPEFSKLFIDVIQGINQYKLYSYEELD